VSNLPVRGMMGQPKGRPDALREGCPPVCEYAAIWVIRLLDPPLETILADQHERVYPDNTAGATREVREKKNDGPPAGNARIRRDSEEDSKQAGARS
jgi:hypothetical protein